MATLHLMVGLPGSGKTTEARRLEQELCALRLTADDWHIRLFGHDFHDGSDNREHDRRHALIENLMWHVAARVLALGVDVILDFGCWAKSERDDFRNRARSIGAGFKIHYMDCSAEELWQRLEKRNQTAEGESVFRISKQHLTRWIRQFEPPDPEELH